MEAADSGLSWFCRSEVDDVVDVAAVGISEPTDSFVRNAVSNDCVCVRFLLLELSSGTG